MDVQNTLLLFHDYLEQRYLKKFGCCVVDISNELIFFFMLLIYKVHGKFND
jgi:hypothetical protein